MRRLLDPERLQQVLEAFGRACRGPGVLYLTGGATALLEGWRDSTVDIGLKFDPEPEGAFAAIARIKEELDVNVELASPERDLWRRGARIMTTTADSLEGLPGVDLVSRGLSDLACSKPTAEAALVEVARTRLAELGLVVGGRTVGDQDAELVLYARLGERFPDGDPYGLYCAWLDQLVSFMSALGNRMRRARLP